MTTDPVVPHAVVDTRDVEKVLFGMFMPQGWKMELSSIDGAAAKWQTAVDIAVLIEDLGYDSLWVYDHFHNVPKPANEAVFECWTTMAAISQRTRDIGVLRLLGFTRIQVLVSFLLESIMLALVGGAIGCAIGSLWDGTTANSVVSGGQGGGKFVVLRLTVDAAAISTAMLLALGMGIIGGMFPAVKAVRLKILNSLR